MSDHTDLNVIVKNALYIVDQQNGMHAFKDGQF